MNVIQSLRETFKKRIGDIPPAPDPDVKIVSKRKWKEFDEWKLEYNVENPDSMPEPAGQRIPAYLLIPKYTLQEGDAGRRRPAMICYHQCNVDCHWGKEAVVGKVVERPDQAYGLDLVYQGFVVLAPDSVPCGERFISFIRQEGEEKVCFDPYGQYLERLGRSWETKTIVDGVRSVDLLQTFDFVDQARIGVIGHSGGAVTSVRHMACDERIRFGIVSGLGSPFISEEYLACIAPRPFLQLSGSLDEEGGSPDERHRKIRKIHSLVRPMYEEHHAAGYLDLRIHRCGHHFLDTFKWEAYAKLRKSFGLEAQRETVAITDVLREARQNNWSGINQAPGFPDIGADCEMEVLADRRRLGQAFVILFVHLLSKKPADSCLRVEARAEKGGLQSVTGSDDIPLGN